MPTTGSATITIRKPPHEVWSALTDITRMGEWSPECVGGRWQSEVPGVGARFEGDNVLLVFGRTLKKWTTTSEVTVYEPDRTFAFTAEGYTTWRYDFEPADQGTKVTESFSYVSTGFQGFLYGTLLRRPKAMVKGMQRTLERVKTTLETVS